MYTMYTIHPTPPGTIRLGKLCTAVDILCIKLAACVY
jgi:hypothetical protein